MITIEQRKCEEICGERGQSGSARFMRHRQTLSENRSVDGSIPPLATIFLSNLLRFEFKILELILG